ncbi:hypothetical protein [Cobetia sp. 29-18-1]|uniref:hypothetical protein n=1 Tax=Cobetia sp. 29-18-1 TaxID=3040018 RepID=UPI00244AAB55|nr:hypothetical protein [Cobetia sp. 29-18-1]MDH2299840.1 hypothetical protein [Cobetia sp. 29-18-1]
MENRALFKTVSFVTVVTQILILLWIFHVTVFSEDSDSLALYVVLVIANIILMLGLAVRYIADRNNSENNLYAQCSIWIRKYFSLLIGVVVALTIMVLSSIDKINLHTQPIFYSGMLTMGLGMVATIFTVHGKIPENSRLSNEVDPILWTT